MEIPDGIYVLKPGEIGFVGSPGEFDRASADGYKLESNRVLVADGGKTQIRLFRLPKGETGVMKAKVPGYKIQVIRAGSIIEVEADEPS